MMPRTNHRWRLALALAASLVAGTASAQQNGVEVLARGPVHEGFADPAEQQPGAGAIVAKEPPAAIEELPPDQKPDGDNVQWIPGYWAYDDDRQDFIWISGFWRVPPPNRSWVPGSWRPMANGYQWIAGFWNDDQPQAELEYLPPPPQPVEVGPATPAPSVSHVYVPGSWVYRERYVWRPGFWMDHRPGWVWTPACYRYTPAGYIFVDGYWDFPLADRGVLFAPVYIQPAVFVQPQFVYAPTIIVRDECMYGAMFVRRGHGYYFGDYFEPRYREVGFSAWVGGRGFGVGVGVTRGWGYDPLFSYYSVANRSDPFWNRGIYDTYDGRFAGRIPRPPVTLVQQNNVINNIVVNNTTVNNNIVVNNVNTTVNNVAMLTSVNNVKQVGANRISPLPQASQQEQLARSRELRQVSVQRAAAEKQLVAKLPTPAPNGGPRPTGFAPQHVTPQKVTLDLPKKPTTRPFASNGGNNPPAVQPAKVPPPLAVKNDKVPSKVAPRPFTPPMTGGDTKTQPMTPAKVPPTNPPPKVVDPVRPFTPPKVVTPPTPPKVTPPPKVVTPPPKVVAPPKVDPVRPMTPPAVTPKLPPPPKVDPVRPFTPPKVVTPPTPPKVTPPPPKVVTPPTPPKLTPPPKVVVPPTPPKVTPPPKVVAPPPPKVTPPPTRPFNPPAVAAPKPPPVKLAPPVAAPKVTPPPVVKTPVKVTPPPVTPKTPVRPFDKK